MKMCLRLSCAVLLLAAGMTFSQTRADSSVSILALGDSITYGENVAGGYESPLALALGAKNVTANFVGGATVNGTTIPADGFSGYMINELDGNLTGSLTPYQGSSNLGGYWLTGGSPGPVNENPNVVLLMVGTNDSIIGYDSTLSPTHPYAVTENGPDFAAHMTSRLQTLISDLRTDLPNSLILVAAPPNISFNETIWQGRLTDYAPDVQQMIASNFSPSNVQYVDMFDTFGASDWSLLGSDGVHPNSAGYNLMAQTWASAIMADYNFNGDPATVPEPSTWALLIGGVLALLGWRRYKRQA